MKRTVTTGVFIVFLLHFEAFGQAQPNLYVGFQTPPATYRPLPLWYWNTKIEPEEAKHQIDEYLKQGIQGAIVYACTGLKTPFLSEEWWHAWSEILPYARAKGFVLGWHPEYNIPNGDARDMWKDPPLQSRVLEGHPEYRLKKLAYIEREFIGPGKAKFDSLHAPVIAIAGRRTGSGSLAPETLVDVSSGIHGSTFNSELGPGRWLVTFYYPTLTNTAAWGWTEMEHVDPLNRKATDRYIDLTLGELARRFPEYIGSTFKYVLLDSEGAFGGPIVWTPGFFEIFQTRKGYDFHKYLPLLVNDGGPVTSKIRNDYFEVVSRMFVENFFKPIADWSSVRGLVAVAQEFGDSLQLEPGYGGDFMAIETAMSLPFVEDLGDDFRVVRQFKEPASIAHFEGKRFWCECQLIQGAGSYMSPQKMRFGANVIAAWGVNLWSQNTSFEDFDTWWPPSMGQSQPYWNYFHHYADLLTRISYMNDGGRHVSDILLFRPTASAVAEAAPAFDNNRGNFFGRGRSGYAEVDLGSHAESVAPTQDIPSMFWDGDFSWQVEMDYWALMQLLVQKQQDYDVVNDLYLARSRLENGAVRLGQENYHIFVLPPMRVISRASLNKIADFYQHGIDIVAYGSLPSGSTEHGMADPKVIETIRQIFGIDPRGSEQATKQVSHHNGQSGRAVFIPHGLRMVPEVIARLRPPDFQVVKGSTDQLFYLHRQKDKRDLYWIANDSEASRQLTVSLAAQGRPELWEPTDGTRRVPVYWKQNDRTVVYLNLGAWDGTYIVFGPELDTAAHPSITGTNLNDVQIEPKAGHIEASGWIGPGEKMAWIEGVYRDKTFRAATEHHDVTAQVLTPEGWDFSINRDTVVVQYAQTAVVHAGEGEGMGFSSPEYNDRAWDTIWLSRQSRTIRDWNLIGPFPNVDHQGFNEAYPPEKETNLEARYTGAQGQEISWKQYSSRTPETHVQKALALTNAKSVVYAQTYVWSPIEQQVQAILAGENLKLFVNNQEVFKFHSMPVDSELRDGFAFRPVIKLNQGWNNLLVKVEHDFNPIAFFLRLSDLHGAAVPGLLVSSRPDSPERLQAQQLQAVEGCERWYRFQVPPGTAALRLPRSARLRVAYLNGRPLPLSTDGRLVFGSQEWNRSNVLALVVPLTSELDDSVQFETAKGRYRLGSWTWTGLSSFSGSATYEKTFDLDPSLVGKRIDLDLGRVGVTAEVWLNDKRVGERVWQPYVLDVSRYLQPGKNRLRILVSNSDSNRRAEADPRRYMERKQLPGGDAVVYMDMLSLNGLLGPVQLVPYERVSLLLPQ